MCCYYDSMPNSPSAYLQWKTLDIQKILFSFFICKRLTDLFLKYLKNLSWLLNEIYKSVKSFTKK